MRLFLFMSCLLALPALGQPGPDSIGRLVSQLEASGGLWVNGISPLLPYPASIRPEVLVREILGGYDWARDRPFQIVEQREVQIDSDKPYQALLVETVAGRRIILLQYQPGHDWRSKVLEAPQS
jgi:hypothetical protein